MALTNNCKFTYTFYNIETSALIIFVLEYFIKFRLRGRMHIDYIDT